MLHHAKVMQALNALQDELFLDLSENFSVARASWQRIVNDPTFSYKMRSITSPWLLPTWQEPMSTTYAIDEPLHIYRAIAVDGSQVYPDRHQGTSCYLINIGSVCLDYGVAPHVQLASEPYVFAGRKEDESNENPMDMVNAQRQELEFHKGFALATIKTDVLQAFLIDGSLIFWHLAGEQNEVKDRYIKGYLKLMEQFYEKQLLHGGYISLPKSKELVNLIRVELCNFVPDGCTDHKVVDYIVDATVAGFYLKPGQRTIVFKSNAVLCKQYPEHLVPHFFYMHVGTEIARVEIPAWIAQDQQKTQLIAGIMYDQAKKGNGYPVALAEAHEQAVVKGPDREIFYQMLQRLAVQHKRQQIISQKSSKKRIIGI